MVNEAYNILKKESADGNIDWVSDDMKVMLVSGSVTFDGTELDMTVVSALEVVGTGYTAGGASIASLVVTQNNSLSAGHVDGTDLTFTALDAGTIAAAVIYRSAGSPANIPCLYLSSGGDFPITTNGGDVTLNWNATSGILLYK